MDENYVGFVSMTDTFLSGWGCSKDKIAKLVICCRSSEDVENALKWSYLRDEMSYITFSKTKPYYRPSRYQVTYWDYDETKSSIEGYIQRKE